MTGNARSMPELFALDQIRRLLSVEQDDGEPFMSMPTQRERAIDACRLDGVDGDMSNAR
ncbi:hypothetical protein [Burkholderia metallica]|uniref:hypothetical protein n=1 Tax=Burkholderia metallica TaxID=488729 RepID=UPI001577659C|nr:hypothetical protein [Burkholderia metallica]